MYLATSSHSVYSLLYCIVLFEQKACVVSWYSLFSHPGIFFVFGTFLAGPAYHYWFNYLDELPAHAYRLKQLRQRGEYVERPNKYVEKWTKLESVGKFLPFFLSFSVFLFPFVFFFNSPPSSSITPIIQYLYSHSAVNMPPPLIKLLWFVPARQDTSIVRISA